MAKKSEVKTVETVTPEAVTPKEKMSYVLTMPDGTIIEGNTAVRPFKPNVGKGLQNSGFQVRIDEYPYSGNIMVIDADKKVLI